MINRIVFIFCFLIFVLNYNKSIYRLTCKYNKNHTSTIYLLKNNFKIDSLQVFSYYGKDSIISFSKDEWKYFYSKRCGSGCLIGNQIILTVENNKLKQKLHIEAFYEESVLGDETLTKYFKRIFSLKKIGNELELKKVCIKNGIYYYTKIEKLFFEKKLKIYYNKKFTYNGKCFFGVKIDSSEYIYYKNKWNEFDDKKNKIY